MQMSFCGSLEKIREALVQPGFLLCTPDLRKHDLTTKSLNTILLSIYNMKQAILIRQDLKMSKGKLAVQAAHASVEAVLKSDKRKVSKWRMEGMTKAVLKVSGLKELYRYKQLAEDVNLKTALITDAAKTFFKEPTTTSLGIGPDEDEKIDEITGKLKLL